MSMMHQFLSQTEATIVVTEGRGFSRLAETLGPVELGLTLSSYYGHVGGIVEKNGGRIVKFIGDGMLAAFIGADHRGRALAACAEMERHRDGWLADAAKVKLPPLDYVIAAASGEVLVGELGTDRLRFWDVIGAPVNLAFRLAALAVTRGASHLLASDTVEKATTKPAVVEVDPAEVKGVRHRLFRVG